MSHSKNIDLKTQYHGTRLLITAQNVFDRLLPLISHELSSRMKSATPTNFESHILLDPRKHLRCKLTFRSILCVWFDCWIAKHMSIINLCRKRQHYLSLQSTCEDIESWNLRSISKHHILGSCRQNEVSYWCLCVTSPVSFQVRANCNQCRCTETTLL